MRFLPLLALFVVTSYAHSTTYGEDPEGYLTSLYNDFNVLVIELDQDSFDDTVFCEDLTWEKCTGFVVQFYHSKSPLSISLALPYLNASLTGFSWQSVVRFGVINCADSYNHEICKEHGFIRYPIIKYFSRSATEASEGITIDTDSFETGKILREIIEEVRDDYKEHEYKDWPDFIPLSNHYSSFDSFWTKYPGRTEVAMVYADDLNSPETMTILVVLHKAAQGLPIELVFKGHFLDRNTDKEYPYASVLAQKHHMRDNCDDPEAMKQESEYKHMMERLGLSFVPGDVQQLVNHRGESIYECRNYTSRGSSRYYRSVDALLLADNASAENQTNTENAGAEYKLEKPDFSHESAPALPNPAALSALMDAEGDLTFSSASTMTQNLALYSLIAVGPLVAMMAR